MHENVARFILFAFNDEVRRLGLDYIVERNAVVRTVTKKGQVQGRNPDVSVIDRTLWESDLTSYAALGEPFQLAVEVASTNWRDDYIDKLDEYQRLGILEYWIVDYLPLATAEYIGENKAPTVSVYMLTNDQYQVSQFRNTDRIICYIKPT